MSKRVTTTPTPPPPRDDDDLDRFLTEAFRAPGDDDTALLSRSVLSALAEQEAWHPQRAQEAEVLSEPLAWGAGFGVLMLGLGALGYVAIPVLDGGVLMFLTEITGLSGLLGGS
jgi:hypothetical protein